jgi:hypothetical protein
MKVSKIIYLAFSTLVLSTTSCEKKLELLPEQDLSGEAVFSSKGTAQSALFGVYNTFQLLEVNGSLPQVISEYMADNVEFVGSFPTLQDINNYITVSDNVSIRDIWQLHYRAILRANKVIAEIPNVPDPTFTSEEKAQAVAEAKFLRALAYFQLANLFAQPYQVSNGTNDAVPLIIDAFEGEITFPTRANLNSVHAQIRTDLTEAIPDLPLDYGNADENSGRATVGAAHALLSRLHLYRDELTDAIREARAVIATNRYTLATNYGFYDGNTAEDVFSIQNSSIDNGRTGSGGWAAYYVPAALGGRGDAPFSANLVAAYATESGDRRFSTLSAVGVAADNISRPFTTKFPDAITNGDNSPVIRITEVYLNLAEALAKNDPLINSEAISIINNLRSRANLSPRLIYASKQALVDAILIERRKELAFEGHRRMDLLRNRLPLRTGVAAAAFGADKTILPIPLRERDLNPNLSQNRGY